MEVLAMHQSSHRRSVDPCLVISIVLLFVLPGTSLVMTTMVLLALPSMLCAWATGMLFGRIPMLIVAVTAFMLMVVTLIKISLNLLW
jgi:hypothetical protein